MSTVAAKDAEEIITQVTGHRLPKDPKNWTAGDAEAFALAFKVAAANAEADTLVAKIKAGVDEALASANPDQQCHQARELIGELQRCLRRRPNAEQLRRAVPQSDQQPTPAEASAAA